MKGNDKFCDIFYIDSKYIYRLEKSLQSRVLKNEQYYKFKCTYLALVPKFVIIFYYFI